MELMNKPKDAEAITDPATLSRNPPAHPDVRRNLLLLGGVILRFPIALTRDRGYLGTENSRLERAAVGLTLDN